MDHFVAWFGDTHTVHRFGLLNPDTVLHEEDEVGNLVEFTPNLNAVQQFLWKLYTENRQAIVDIVGEKPLTVIHGGDLGHGQKHPEQLMSTRWHDQIRAGVDILDCWPQLPNLRALRVLMGTGAHSPEGSVELLAVDMLQERYPEVDIAAVGHNLIHLGGEMASRQMVDGIVIDAAHHGPGPGIREWTEGNQVRYYMRSLIFQDIRNGRQPPDLILRFHRHSFIWETLHYYYRGSLRTSHGFICPSMCGMSYYARQATKSQAVNDFGMFLAGIENGMVARVWPLAMRLDIRTEEWL